MSAIRSNRAFPLSLLLAISAAACADAPFADGLAVESLVTETSSSTTYRSIDDGEPEVSSGVLGDGVDCTAARSTAGSDTSLSITETRLGMKVVGHTKMGHPLVPGDDEFDPVGVSIVTTTAVATTAFERRTETYDMESESLAGTVVTRGGGTQTESRLVGIVADEYVVQLQSLGDLWDDLESENSQLNVSVLTRHNPVEGDIWASQNGAYIYMFVGMEPIDIRGVQVLTARVDVSAVGAFDPTAAGLMETCVAKPDWKIDSEGSDADTNGQELFLDDGCLGDFVFQKVGSEWWIDGILVKEETRVVTATVSDFGYEWYTEEDEACTRQTSTRVASAVEGAVRFIEYTATEWERSLVNTGWEEPGLFE